MTKEFETRLADAPQGAHRFTALLDPKQTFAEPEEDHSGVRPVRMIAFNGEPMRHWWFGPCVFDRSGFQTSSDQIPIDYDHDPNQIMGHLDRFSGNPELICEGVLIPFGNDRAAEVIHKSKNGQKYQCSVTVAEYVRTEQLEEGASATVNGMSVQGPITIFREYKIMGVAICPYGTDKQTETQIFKNKEPETMPKTDTDPKPATTGNGQKTDDRQLFKKFIKLFGDKKAAKYFADELDEEQAKEQYIDDVQEEVESLEKKVETLETEVKEKDEKIAELETQLSDKGDGGESKPSSTEKEHSDRIAKLESELAQARNAAGQFKAEPAPVSGNQPGGDAKPKTFSPFGPETAAYAGQIRTDIQRAPRDE